MLLASSQHPDREKYKACTVRSFSSAIRHIRPHAILYVIPQQHLAAEAFDHSAKPNWQDCEFFKNRAVLTIIIIRIISTKVVRLVIACG